MVNWKLSSLLLISLRALNAFAAIEVENVEEIVDDAQTPNLQVSVSVSFPQSEIFGVKLINGHATEARLAVTNNEPDAISIALVGGSLVKDGPEPQILRNLTSKQYMLEVPAGEEETIPYSFSTEMHPQDVRLQLMAVLKDKKNAFYTVSIYNETVSIVEAPTSIFDPQIIFLYIVILGAFGGTVYFIYNTWITTFFPQKKRSGRSGEPRPKKVVPADTNLEGTDGPAVSTGSKPYDESWIPAAHLQRPEAKRVRSGTPKTKAKA